MVSPMAHKVYFQQRSHWAAKAQMGQHFGGLGGRSWKFVLSRSMRISVPFPYARISTASLSICSSVKPDLRLMIFRSCAAESVNGAGLNGVAAWRGVSRKWRDKQCW